MGFPDGQLAHESSRRGTQQGNPVECDAMQRPCQAPETDETPSFQRPGREGAFPSACALS